MDYESVLFDLQPILETCNLAHLPRDGAACERYLSVLDRVAVCLRSEQNRCIAGSSGLLLRLLGVLEGALAKCFSAGSVDDFWWSFASDLIRCVANCLVDNDENRKTLLEHRAVILDLYVGQICQLDPLAHEELQMRTLAMAKNMCLDSTSYSRRFGPKIAGPLLGLLRQTGHDETLGMIGSGLLSDFIAVGTAVTLEDLQFFAESILRFSNGVKDQEQEQLDDDLENPQLEIVESFSQCLESVVSKEGPIDFAQHRLVSPIQSDLMQALDVLLPKIFVNKLICMRRLMACVGHISAHGTNSNRGERAPCYDVVCRSRNGYKIGAALVVLSNSVHSPRDATEVIQDVSFDQLISSASQLKDPMQMQGFLDLLRKLLNITNAMELTPETVQRLSTVLKTCHDQCTFFQNISPLLDGLLKKLLTVLPSSTVQDSLSHGFLLEIITSRDSVISCLALDKMLICKRQPSQDLLHSLWHSACKFQDQVASGEGHISIFYLFQLAKTFGIYLKNLDTGNDPLGDFYKGPLIQLLEFIKPLLDKNDQASQSAVNNGKFVATMVTRLVTIETEDAPLDTQLLQAARALF